MSYGTSRTTNEGPNPAARWAAISSDPPNVGFDGGSNRSGKVCPPNQLSHDINFGTRAALEANTKFASAMMPEVSVSSASCSMTR